MHINNNTNDWIRVDGKIQGYMNSGIKLGTSMNFLTEVMPPHSSVFHIKASNIGVSEGESLTNEYVADYYDIQIENRTFGNKWEGNVIDLDNNVFAVINGSTVTNNSNHSIRFKRKMAREFDRFYNDSIKYPAVFSKYPNLNSIISWSIDESDVIPPLTQMRVNLLQDRTCEQGTLSVINCISQPEYIIEVIP